MISTLAMIAATAMPFADADKTDFSHSFKKDSTSTFAIELTGESDFGEIEAVANFEFKVSDLTEKGGVTAEIRISDATANIGGQPIPTDATNMDVELDKHGLPSDIQMSSFEFVFYLALISMYLPNQALDEGDKFRGEADMGQVKYAVSGSYLGDEGIDGKTFSVLKSSGELVPEDGDAITLEVKAFFDKTIGRIVRTETQIETPDGDLKLIVKLKPKD